MIEAYLFHAMFAAQVVLGSVLIPRRLIQRARQQITRGPTPLPPGGEEWVQRSITQYRMANGAVVVLGLLLMGFLFSYMSEADWRDGPVEVWIAPYLVLQCLPVFVAALRVWRVNREREASLPLPRKRAVLQRRGLFDFVSPVVVGLALLCYPLFIAMVFYIQRDPFPGFAGPHINIAIVTVQYCITASLVYFVMYGRNRDSQQTHTERMRQMEKLVTLLIYSCLIAVVGLMINFSLVLLDQQRLEPFAQTTSFVIAALWIYRKVSPVSEDLTQGACRSGFSS